MVTIIKRRKEGRMSRSEVRCQHWYNICNFIFFVYDMMTILTCYDINFGWMIPKYKHILTFTYSVHMTNQHSFVLKECIVISISDPKLVWLTARIFLHSKSITANLITARRLSFSILTIQSDRRPQFCKLRFTANTALLVKLFNIQWDWIQIECWWCAGLQDEWSEFSHVLAGEVV